MTLHLFGLSGYLAVMTIYFVWVRKQHLNRTWNSRPSD